jgi:predicted Zn-dependent peptidase
MRTDSDPTGRLVEQFLATAYVAHNYGRSGVGWPSEVSQITATQAMEFHRKYYVGANIVVAVAGDVKASEALPMLEKYFGRVPGGPKPEEMTTVEPKQFAEKTVTIREQTQPFFIEGYHRPDFRDPDSAVYDAISDIMSNGRVSRLYRSLVRDQQIAAQAQGFSPYPGGKYPGLFAFYAVPVPGHTPAEMRDAIHKEIARLQTADVSDEELQMFKTRTRANLLSGLADNQGLAFALSEYQTRYGDWRELFLQLYRVDKVTKAD